MVLADLASDLVFSLQVKALEKKASRKSALESILKDASTTCLVTPFTDAVAQGKRYTCTALTKSWVAYISRQQVILSTCWVVFTTWQAYSTFHLAGSRVLPFISLKQGLSKS